MVLWGAVRDRVADRVILGQLVGVDVAGMQEAEMRGIDVALERLQKIAVALDARHADLGFGHQ